MHPSPAPEPESTRQRPSTISSSSRCNILKMMTPIFIWNNLLPTNESASSSMQRTVTSLSSKFSNGIRDLRGGFKQKMQQISNWRSNYSRNEQSDLQNLSIGSRGYDEFRGDDRDFETSNPACNSVLGKSSTILNNSY